MAYKHPSQNRNGKHYADVNFDNGLDQFRIRLRITALLRAFGPMRTEAIIVKLADYPERLVRITLHTLEDEGVALRPIQGQRWRLIR